MRTYTAPFQPDRQVQFTSGKKIIPAMLAASRQILALTGAAISAAAVVLLSVWVAGMQMTNVIGAGIWGIGFVFLGLAIDNLGMKGLALFVTGGALFVLAWMQSVISADYIVISGIIVAAWVAMDLYRRLR